MKTLKLLLQIFIFIVFNYGFCQSYNTINYKAVLNLTDDIKKVDKKFNLLSKAEDVSEDVNFRLEIDVDKSVFYVSNEEDIDPMSLHMLKSLTLSKGNIFTNQKDNTIQNEVISKGNMSFIFGKDNLLVQDSIFKNWDITNEKKIIDGYTCYKANYKQIKKVLDKTETTTAIAWFCPDIPISFGPAQFSGLPGLIFQLDSNLYSFNLLNFTFNKDLILKKSVNGKIISLEEYLETIKTNMEKLKEMAKNYKEEKN
jgi:GLPGLI family protein